MEKPQQVYWFLVSNAVSRYLHPGNKYYYQLMQQQQDHFQQQALNKFYHWFCMTRLFYHWFYLMHK